MPILDTFAAKASTSQAAFVGNAEETFWVRARRNHLLADWACDLTDENNQAYLRLLLDADFAKVETRAEEGFLMLKIRNDLMGFGVFLTADQMKDVCAWFERQAWLERHP
ncbi:MAG: ATPase inhibitor subunit zeta [Bacteroidota bacterium]